MKPARGILALITALLIVAGGVSLALPEAPETGKPTEQPAGPAERLTEPEEPEPEESPPPEEPEPEEEAEPPVILDATSEVVYSYAELKSALTGNNGITTVYLGDNITMAGGIIVSSTKASITIDGINPLSPQDGRHTLTEYSSADILATIYIDNPSTKAATLKNLVVTGKNYFGPVCVSALYDVTLTYDNISYTGPQLSYNLIGTCRYIDSDISVTTNNGSLSLVQELCQTRHAVFGGSVTVTGSASANALMWLTGANSSLTVLEGADVRLTSQNNYVIYSDGGAVACTVGSRALLDISCRYGLFYNSSELLHQFKSLTVGENGGLFVNQLARSPLLTPTLKTREGLTVMHGGKLEITVAHDSAYPLIQFMTNGAGAVFSDPDSVVLSNRTGKLFDWYTGSGAVDITADAVCYWTQAASAAEAAGFAKMPDMYWSKLSGELFRVRAGASSSAVTDVSSNFEDGADEGESPDVSNFNIISARMLSLGRLPLILDPSAADAGVVTGESAPYAALRLEHSSFGTLYDSAYDSGLICVQVPGLDYPGTVRVTAQRELLFKTGSTEVLPPQTLKILEFQHVPELMPFGRVPISAHGALCERAVPDWTIVLSDTRDIGAPWSLYVRVLTPLRGEAYNTLPGALVWYDGSGDPITLGETAHKAADGVKDSPEHTVKLKWGRTEGLLLQTPPGLPYAGSYTATLEWILVDSP